MRELGLVVLVLWVDVANMSLRPSQPIGQIDWTH